MSLVNNFDPEEPAVMIVAEIAGGMLFVDAQGLVDHLREMADVIELHNAEMRFISLKITPNGFEMSGVKESLAEITSRRPSEVN